MTSDEIIKIIDAIPQYIQYIYPGYLTIYSYYFFKGRSLKDTKAVIIKAIAISYIYIIFLENFNIRSALYENIFLLILAIVCSFITYTITQSDFTLTVLNFFGIRTTFYEDEFESLAGVDKGAWVCVYLNNDSVVYEGSIGYKELEEEKRKYISLDAYYKYFLDGNGCPNEPYIEDHEGNYKETVVIFYDDIKRIEKRDVSSVN